MYIKWSVDKVLLADVLELSAFSKNESVTLYEIIMNVCYRHVWDLAKKNSIILVSCIKKHPGYLYQMDW